MNNYLPLTSEEKQEIIDAGWAFANEEYIYIPDDYDGCMAHGIARIRDVLNGIRKTRKVCNVVTITSDPNLD